MSFGGGFSGGGAPPVADTTLKRLALTPDALAGSSALSALSITQTWNTTGVPTALLVDVTDTASDMNSLLADFKVGGVSKFFVRKDGVGSFNVAGSITFNTGAFFLWAGAGGIAGSTNGEFDFFRSGYSASTKLVVPSSNVLQIGQNHATAATAQTIKAHDVTTGTGADLVLAGGTGSVANGNVVLNGANRAPYDAAPIATTIRDILISHGLMAAS